MSIRRSSVPRKYVNVRALCEIYSGTDRFMTINPFFRIAGIPAQTILSSCENSAEGIDVRVIAEDVALGLGERETPQQDDRAALEIRLRDHITYLAPQLRRKIDELWRGSAEWSLLSGHLDVIKQRVTTPTPCGDRATRFRVGQLARDCQWLLEQHRKK